MGRQGSAPAIFQFTVEGPGEFPFDMLARDACYPMTTDDAMAMLLAFPRRFRPSRRFEGAQEPKVHRIQLASAAGPPTIEGWRSFGWSVTQVSEGVWK
jgi:hypothetical protein